MRALATLAFGAALLAGLPAAAAPVVVPIDQSIRLNVPGAAYSVLVGSPAIADVTVVDSRTLYITGRAYGATDVVVLDRSGSTLFRGDVVVSAPEVGRVSVYRGAARTDLACAPRCQVSARSGGGDAGGAGGGSGPASPPAPAAPGAAAPAAATP